MSPLKMKSGKSINSTRRSTRANHDDFSESINFKQDEKSSKPNLSLSPTKNKEFRRRFNGSSIKNVNVPEKHLNTAGELQLSNIVTHLASSKSPIKQFSGEDLGFSLKMRQAELSFEDKNMTRFNSDINSNYQNVYDMDLSLKVKELKAIHKMGTHGYTF